MPVTMYVIHAVQLVPGRVAIEYTKSADPVRHEVLMNSVMYHVTICMPLLLLPLTWCLKKHHGNTESSYSLHGMVPVDEKKILLLCKF